MKSPLKTFSTTRKLINIYQGNQNIYKDYILILNMARLRIIKKYGGTHFIQITSTDMRDFNLKEGDQIDIDDLIKIRGDKHGNKKRRG